MSPGMSTPFGALRQVDAGLLSVGYAEAGSADGPVVMLLHGWPYDIHSFAEVTPVLAAAGYRVIVPFVRGYGPTRFLSGDTLRNGQQAALAADVTALMDAPGIQQAILAGFADASAYAGKFTGKSEHRVIGGGVGHNLPQEAPQAFAQAVIDVDHF